MSYYFTPFPQIGYDLERTGQPKAVVNLMVRTALTKRTLLNSTMYGTYRVKDGETPEIIAAKLYDNAGYYWLVLFANQILDPYFDWVIDGNTFNRFVTKKYPGFSLFVDEIDGEFATPQTVTVEDKDDPRGTIHRWDPTFNRLEIRDSNDIDPTGVGGERFFTVGDTIKTNTGTARIRRIVQQSRFAIHHFETSGGVWLDPYGNESGIATNKINRYLDGENQGTDDFSDFRVVTNEQYESDENEKRREIRLLKPQYVEIVMTEFEEVLDRASRQRLR